MFSRTLLTVCFVAIVSLFSGCYSKADEPLRAARNTPDTAGLLKPAPGYRIVKQECTRCHSEKLIVQNRASREGWADTIRWMQNKQGLRAFSPDEKKEILDYLAANYAPKAVGRRTPLVVHEWYSLEP